MGAQSKPTIRRLVHCATASAERPNVAAYLESPRRLGWNDHDMFRYYAELSNRVVRWLRGCVLVLVTGDE